MATSKKGGGSLQLRSANFTQDGDELDLSPSGFAFERVAGHAQVHLKLPGQAVHFLPPAAAAASATDLTSWRVKMLSILSTCTKAPALRPCSRGWGVQQRLGAGRTPAPRGGVPRPRLSGILLPPLALVAAQVVNVEEAVGLVLGVQVALDSIRRLRLVWMAKRPVGRP